MASKTLSDVKNKALLQTKGYINDAWVDAASGATFDVINPATLERLPTRRLVQGSVPAGYGNGAIFATRISMIWL
jgi:hypothetical protein